MNFERKRNDRERGRERKEKREKEITTVSERES
jgi:hypothetical protein